MTPETLHTINGVRICAQTFGSPEDPAILLIHGASASMVWWEAELCRRIAAAGRYVIRYDQRDTGRSVTYPVGEPGYTSTDLTLDAIGLLDALRVQRAHVVGRSMSGAIALGAALDHADRVSTLTLVSTSTGDLPFGHVEAPGMPEMANDDEAVDYIVAAIRAYAGRSPHFDEAEVRALAAQDVARSVDLRAAMVNHFRMEFVAPQGGSYRDVRVPTLVVQGECDPVFGVPHGQALHEAIAGSQLVVVRGSGHDVLRPAWDQFVPALVRHTAS